MSQESASVQTVKDQLDENTISKAEEHGVDLDGLIENKISQFDGYRPGTIANFVQNDIDTEIEAQQAEKVRGLIMGVRDRYGSNAPRRIAIVRSNCEHIEASTFGGNLPGPGGDDIPIPDGGVASELRVRWNDEFDNYDAVAIESYTEMDPAELRTGLDEIANRPSELSPNDEGELVVVKGEVAFVNPQTIFEDGQPSGDGPVLMPDERTGEGGKGNLQYHFEVSLEDDGNTRARGHFGRQAYGRPYAPVPELDRLVHDAYQNFDTPDEQAEFIQTGIRGREVVLIGYMNDFNPDTDDDGQVRNYISIQLTAIVDIEDPEQTTIDESTEETDDHEDTDEAEDAGDSDEEDTDDSDETDDSDGSAVLDDAIDTIDMYTTATGVDVNTLTLETVQENLDVDAPDAAIRQALNSLQDSDEEDTESEDGDDGSELVFDPSDCTNSEVRTKAAGVDDIEALEAVREAEESDKNRKGAKEALDDRIDYLNEDPMGTSDEEPVEDGVEGCLFQASTTGEITGHFYDEHGISGDPVDFVEEHTGDDGWDAIKDDDGMYHCPAPEPSE